MYNALSEGVQKYHFGSFKASIYNANRYMFRTPCIINTNIDITDKAKDSQKYSKKVLMTCISD